MFSCKRRIGRVQRARDRAVALALGPFAQIDERDVGLADQRLAPRPHVTAQPRRAISSCTQSRPACWPAPPRPSSSGWAASGCSSASTYSSIDLTWRRGLKRLLLADGGDRVALVVVRRIDQRLVRQLAAAGRRSTSYCARGSPFWKSVRPVPRISSVSPVNTRSGHDEAVGIVGVAGRVDARRARALDGELLAVGEPHRHHVGLGSARPSR